MFKMPVRQAGLGLAFFVTSLFALPAQADFVNLSGVGKNILDRCNPANAPGQQRCRVASLPGLAGYTLVASRSAPIVRNEVTIGSVSDRVWRDRAGNHIFGMRLQLNSALSDLTGLTYNVNDAFRQTLPDQPVAIAYLWGAGERAVAYAGRTVMGLNEAPEPDPLADPPVPGGLERDNGWVDFGIDANAGEGRGAGNSPWLLVKTRAPAGFSLQPFAIRLLSSDFGDFSEFSEIFLPGYQPN